MPSRVIAAVRRPIRTHRGQDALDVSRCVSAEGSSTEPRADIIDTVQSPRQRGKNCGYRAEAEILLGGLYGKVKERFAAGLGFPCSG